MLVKIAGAVLVGLLLAAGIHVAGASGPDWMAGWYAYDYRAANGEPTLNVFRASTDPGDGSVWVDDLRWSIDDPESPPSVLALVRYEQWNLTSGTVEAPGTTGYDLHGRCVSFDLTGRDLDLHGAAVTFWVMSSTHHQRWHVVTPLEVGGDWTRNRVVIDTAKWRQSWQRDPTDTPDLAGVLATANSFGVAFVGFDGEPTGRLGMRDFRVGC